MFNDVTVIGAGRAGSTIAARLRERGIAVRDDGELRLLCVPDRAIAEVARAIEPGPWVAHVSGGTPLDALAPHTLALLGPSAADADAGPRTGAARRRLGSGDRRERRRPRSRALAGRDARPAAVRARRRPAGALPRRRVDRLELPRDALPRGGAALRAGRRAAGCARPADGADDRERFRADRPDRTRRLGDRRAATLLPCRAASSSRSTARWPRRRDRDRRARTSPTSTCHATAPSVSCRRWARCTAATRRSSPPRGRRATCWSQACSSTPRSSPTPATWAAIPATSKRTLHARKPRTSTSCSRRRRTRSIRQVSQHGSCRKARPKASKERTGPVTSAASQPSA